MKKILEFIICFTLVPFITSEIFAFFAELDRKSIWTLCSISFLVVYLFKAFGLTHFLKFKYSIVFLLVYLCVCLLAVGVLQLV